MAEIPGWTLGVTDFLGEVLGNWDMRHHEGQILITTQVYDSLFS